MILQNKLVRFVLLLLRLAIGGVLVYAAWVKLREPAMLFAISIDAYHVLPEWAVKVVAHTLPWIELAMGLFLIAGRWLRASGTAASALLLLFFTLMVRSYVRGDGIDCGCFGPGEAISPITLLRDGSLLAASLLVTVAAFLRKRKPGPAAESSLAGPAAVSEAR